MNFRLNDEYPNLDYFRIAVKSGLLSTMVIFLAFEVFHLSPVGQLISEVFFLVFKHGTLCHIFVRVGSR